MFFLFVIILKMLYTYNIGLEEASMKRVLFFLFFLLSLNLLWSETITIKSLMGKVEIKSPGGSWQTAKRGMTISEKWSISTGFQSMALLDTGSADVKVMAMTRMRIDQLSQNGNTRNTSLNLSSGKIKARVRKSTGKLQNFKVSSPVATAAVRGTTFTFDGFELEVEEGEVRYANRAGEGRRVRKRQRSSVGGKKGPASHKEQAEKEHKVSAVLDFKEDSSFDQDEGLNQESQEREALDNEIQQSMKARLLLEIK